MTSDQAEYCGECPKRDKCRICLKQGKDPKCPYAG